MKKTNTDYAVIYLDYDGLENNVFESQVLAFCKSIAKRGILIQYIGFNLPRKSSPNAEKKKAKAAAQMPGRINWRFKPPYLGSANLFLNAVALLPFMLSRFRGRTVVFHCRSQLSGRIALFLKAMMIGCKCKVITDYRGVHAEHFETYPEINTPIWSPWLQQRKIRSYHEQNRICTRDSDYKLAVSTALQRHYGLTPCTIIRCNYDQANFNLEPSPQTPRFFPDRAAGELVLLYSGGLQEYQCISETVKVFRQWTARFGAKLIFLTQDKKTAAALLSQSGAPAGNYHVDSGSPENLRGYFHQADFAFILRHDNIVNRVASPVKIGEYLGCGVPLLFTGCTGDLAEIGATRPIGIDMDLARIGDAAYLDGIYARMVEFKTRVAREQVARIAEDYFSLEDGVDKLIDIYRTLAAQ
jgi:hypothetical protein